MSVYNAESYLAEAIESILNQTFTDFEFIIINDGSSDKSADILRRYTDPRIRLFEQENIGLTRSLNKALSLATGEYIARMDADDVSMPERFAQQVAYLQTHSGVGIVGTGCIIRDEIQGKEHIHLRPETDKVLRKNLIKGNPFIHTSVMMRRALLQLVKGYDESFPYIQDYELWIRLAQHTQLANLSEPLVIHREHWHTVSTVWKTEFYRTWLRMRIRYRAFRAGNYPFGNFLYVLQPILFAAIELRPKLKTYIKQWLHFK